MRRHSISNTTSTPAPRRPHVRLGLLSAGLVTLIWALPAAAAVPPVPTQGSPACGAAVGGKCYVGSSFSISTSSPGAHHFKICRSNDVTGWGGCSFQMSANTGSTYTVSGSNLPSDGFRRAYYWSACDSANACTGWADNPEVYVYRDASGPSAPGNTQVACAHVAGGTCWVQGNFTVSVNAATDALSGVDGYQICRSHNSSGGFAGCDFNMTLAGGTSYTVSGSHLPSDGFRRAYWFRAKDRVGNWGAWNSPKYVQVDRYAPTASASGASPTWGSGATATISAADTTGGASANSGLQHVRYRWNAALNGACTNGTVTSSGATLTAPEGDNRLYVCARDRVGRVSHWNGQYRVDTTPPSAPGNTTVACTYSTTAPSECWVTGNFTASATPATDASGIAGYHICRSHDRTGGFAGCDVTLDLDGGTSIFVSGANLPSSGFRRSYWFRAQDNAGNWGPWNSPRYVRVDRNAPSVSASGASTTWVTSASAAVSAADTVGGASANSGLKNVRYRWNAPTNGACTNGTVTSPGATLSAPSGDNVLYLCARDNAGRIAQWTGQYRVDGGPPSAPGNTTVACAHTSSGGNCWVQGSFVASVTPATDPSGIAGYQVCRSNDSTGGFSGCDINMTLAGGTSYTVTGAHLPSDGFRRAYWFRAQDNSGAWGDWNSPRYVRVDRHDPRVSATNASPEWFEERSATIQANDTEGGGGANTGLADVRYRWNASTNGACTNGTATSSGATLNVPVGDNVLYLCARDQVGRVKQWNGQYRVDVGGPPPPGPTTVSCGLVQGGNCWVTGDFVATVTPASDPSGIDSYQICRSEDSTGGFAGCDVNMTLTGGTSYTVSGGHLPSDGFRRAYWFRARDNNGMWGDWNQPRYVRVDRYDPRVSATNASDQWFAERTLVMSADDAGGPGAGVNTGLAQARYRWNAPTNAGCTNGTVFTSGDSLTVPEGGNVLYLCGRDRAGRVGTWNGNYRVDNTQPVRDSLTVSSQQWSIGDGTTYQIKAKASDTGSGIRELRALINHQGSNSANPRGNFSWRDQSLGYLWSADQVPCQGGGFASKRPDAFNPGTVTLVGCATSLAGNQRTVTFTVRPEASYGEHPANDIAFWTRDFRLNATNWLNYDLNFSTVDLPAARLMVLDGGSALAHNATVDWGSVDQGSGSGNRLPRTMTVRNAAPTGSSALVLVGSPSNIQITGSSKFSIGGTLDSPLQPGQQDTFEVRLDTSQGGTFSAQLQIWHSDPVRPRPLRINLRGTVASPPEITSVTPWKIAPGMRTIRIRGTNLGGADVDIPTNKYEPDHPNRVFPVITGHTVNGAGTEITATVDASAAGIDGIYNVVVQKSCDDCYDSVDLRVAPANTPVVDMYTPSEVSAGRVFPMVLTGANLQGSTVSTNHPQVAVLDVDNTDDELVSGILSIPQGVNPGNFDIEIRRPFAPVLTIPVSLVLEGQGQKRNHAVVSEEKLAEARALGAEIPSFFVQEPTLSPSMLARISNGEESPERILSCLFQFTRRLFSFTRVYVIPLDAIGDIDPRVLQAVGLGQLTRFGALTLSFYADIVFQFSFDFCRFTDFGFCIFGTFGAEVVGLEGIRVSFTFCLPFGGGSNSVQTSGGRLSRMNLRSAGNCAQVTQTTDPFGGGDPYANGGQGAHYANALLNQCCPEPVLVDVTLDTFVGVPFFGLDGFEGTGTLTTIQPETASCPDAELTLFLDANRDNDYAAARSSGANPLGRAVDISTLTDIDRYVPCTNPDNNMPVAVGQNQQMSVVAAYVQRDGDQVTIVPPPQGVSQVTFELDGARTSNFAGVAMNWPPLDQSPSSDPDFVLPNAQTQVAFNQDHVAAVQLTCRDYGGHTTIKATPNGANQAEELTIPKPQANPVGPPLPMAGWLPTGGSSPVNTQNLNAETDNDNLPAVNAAGGPANTRGDNLAAFSEYRGFVVDGTLKRLDPNKKDVFVRNELPAARGIGGANQLGLEIHIVDEAEFLEMNGFRFIAFNGGGSFTPKQQSVIRLREGAGTPPGGNTSTIQLGVTSGSLANGNQTPTSTVHLNVIQAIVQGARNIRFTVDNVYDWVLSHEIGHAVDICHRQEDSNGNAVDQDTGQVLPDQVNCPEGGVMIPESRVPNGVYYLHSGHAIDKVKRDRRNTVVGAYHPNSLNQVRVNPN